MHQITILMLTLWFVAIGLFLWLLAGDGVLACWLIFSVGTFSLGRWYEREHATASPDQSAASPARDG